MHVPVSCLLAVSWAALAAPISAQDGAKLNAAEIEAAFVDKTLRGRTERVSTGDPNNPTGTTRRTDGGFIILEFVVRHDSSLIFRCTTHHRGGGSTPCTSTGADAGWRDVGVWTIEADRFCYQWLKARGGQKQCYDVFRAGDRFRWRLASGPPATLDGETVEAR